ncbi:MAG: type II secretion system protein N [Burkholderiaceae bacterium]
MKLPRIAGSTPWVSGLASFTLLALLAGTLMYWSMVLAAPATSIAPAGSLVGRNSGLDTGLAGTLFGRADGAPRIASAPLPRNIKILGIAASSDRSAAIISVDGQAAGAFGVGQQIDDSLKVVSVSAKEVVFEHRGEQIRVPSPASADLTALNSNAEVQANGRPVDSQLARTSPPVSASSRAVASARPPLPPRSLPPAGAAASGSLAPKNNGAPRNRTRQLNGNSPRLAANSQSVSGVTPGNNRVTQQAPQVRRLPQRQTALGQSLQGIGRNGNPVVQQ